MKATRKKAKDVKHHLPTHFDIQLTHRDRRCLEKVVYWMMEHGSHSFQWEMELLEKDIEYRLSIQSCWADNLAHLASLLGDFGEWDWRNE